MDDHNEMIFPRRSRAVAHTHPQSHASAHMWRPEIDLGWLWGGGGAFNYFVKQDLFPEARAEDLA